MSDGSVPAKVSRSQRARLLSRSRTLLAALILLPGASIPCLAVEADTQSLQRALRETQQLSRELEIALDRLNRETAESQARLLQETRMRGNLGINAKSLELTRSAINSLDARVAALNGRIEQQRRDIARVQSFTTDEAGEGLRDALVEAKEQVLDYLAQGTETLEMRRRLAEERLSNLYSRLDLGTGRPLVGSRDDPRLDLAESVISTLVREAVSKANRAAELDTSDPRAREQAGALDLQSDRAIVRANLRQTDLDMMVLDQHIEMVSALALAPGVPVRTLRDAHGALEEAENWLDSHTRTLEAQRETISAQRQALSAQSSEASAADAADLDGLRQLMDFQADELATESERVDALLSQIGIAIEKGQSLDLSEGRGIPRNFAAWQRAAAGLEQLPAAIASSIARASRELRVRFATAAGEQWVMPVVLGLLLASIASGTRRAIPTLAARPPDEPWEAGALSLHPVLWWLLPIGTWITAVVALDISDLLALPVLYLLLAWPVAKFAAGLVALASAALTADSDERHAVSSPWPILAVWGVAFALAACAHWTVVPPLATGLLDSLSLTALLLAAALTLYRVYRSSASRSGWAAPLYHMAIAICVTSLVVAVVGLVGYAELAWTVFRHVAWLLLLGVLLWLSLGLLSRLRDTLPVLLAARRADGTAAWWHGLVRPSLWAASVVLVALAVVAYVRAVSWGTPSPALGWFLDATGLRRLDLASILSGPLGTRIAAAAAEIAVAIVLAYVIWEVIRRSIARYLPDETAGAVAPGEDMGGTGASRISTLMPLIQKFLLITLVAITIMVVLSAIGINIGPLLAGAGVVGIAVGFGAQTLVQDIISGIFFLMDDAFRKGEYIDLGSVKGTVERISVRSLQLRHHNGPVHTVPYGQIQHVTNYSRDWAIMKFELRVPFETDLEKVRKLIKKVGIRLMQDEEIGPLMIQPLKSQGVNRMDDSALIVRCKFTSVPGQQFYVRRVAFTAIQQAFEQKGIQFAPRRVIVESGSSPAAAATAAAAAAAAAASDDRNPDADGPAADEPG